jgi:hypothetical protein
MDKNMIGTCKTCGLDKELKHNRLLCIDCYKASKRAEYHKNKANAPRRKRTTARADKRHATEKQERKDGLYREKFIVRDSKLRDQKAGQSNDLTEDIVLNMISSGCQYCGTKIMARMSLDRIDNSVGHIQSNVLPACIECNLTRGSMPYQAWLVVAKSMREAREIGLFDNWLRRG